VEVERAEGAAPLVEEEGEGVEDRRAARASEVSDRGEESLQLDGETGLLAGLAKDRGQDRLAGVDPAGREAMRAGRVEGLGREQQGTRRPADDHADLGEARGVPDRVEGDVIERHGTHDRRAESAPEHHDFLVHRRRQWARRSDERPLMHTADRSCERR